MTTVRQRQVKPTYRELQNRCDQLAAENEALRNRLHNAEADRAQTQQGLEYLTEALRRRGCCDGHSSTPHPH